MTLNEESIDAAIRAGNVHRCLRLFQGQPENARQDVAAFAERRCREEADAHMESIRAGKSRQDECWHVAAIAVHAACRLAVLQKLGWRARLDHDTTYTVFADRRPSWLGAWATQMLDEHPGTWVGVRRLVREGLCPRPQTDNYLLGMLDHHNGLPRQKGVQHALKADPELLDEVWKLFTLEGGGEWSLANADKYCHPDHTWERGLVALAAEGTLDRGRLLDASLEALQRDFAQYRAGWFSRFHEALLPTVAERQERVDRYFPLLACKIPPTVAFALSALAVLEKAGSLQAKAVVENIRPALAARAKGTVTACIKLIERVVKAEPAFRPEAARIVAEGLSHEAVDVQKLALDFLDRHGDPAVCGSFQ